MGEWTTGTWVKFAVSSGAAFLTGFTTSYQIAPTGPWIAWVMSGLAAVAGYVTGFLQVNPALHKS